MSRSLTAGLEERLLIPAYASRWTSVSIAAHRSLAFPLQVAGEARRRTVSTEAGTYEILELGREKLTAPICARLFGPLPPARQDSRRWALSPSRLAGADADLVVAEVHRWMAPRFQRGEWLLVPDAVRWQGDLDSVPPTEPNRSLREDLRKVRNNGFTIEHTTARADWEEFFATMVRPQALARHGQSAWVPSPSLMRRFQRKGTLHLVSDRGRRVAGLCTIGHGATVWSPLSGVLHGDRELLRQGVSVAGLMLTIEWARAQGYRRLDLGRTGAFVNDGIQHNKRKWGLLPVPDPLAHLAAVLVRSSQLRDAFSREPVLVEASQRLKVYAGEAP